MRTIHIMMTGTVLALCGNANAASLSDRCSSLTAGYAKEAYLEATMNVNDTNIATADFYDTVACECRLGPDQSIREAAQKAKAAIKAELWAAVPMHHDLTPKESREARAFTKWMVGAGSRPNIGGATACTYQRARS